MNGVKRSYTALRQFEFCERQFYFRRILGLPEAPSIHLSLGILYHEALEGLSQGVIAKEALPPLLAKAKASPLWVDPGITDEALIDEIWTNLGRVSREVFKNGHGLKVRKVETWGTRYCCKIDILAGNTPNLEDGHIIDFIDEPCVVDWKTKSGDKKRSQYATDLNPQLALYCIDLGVHNAAIIEIPRSPLQPLNTIVTRFDDYDLARWAKFFDAQFLAMNSRGAEEAEYKLAVRGHGLCSPRWCAYWDRCPGGK